jgi:hypothetical protein
VVVNISTTRGENMPFIKTSKREGTIYAEVFYPQRKNGKKVNDPIYLGKVIDLEKGLFHSRKRGTFKFTLEHGFESFDIENPTLVSPLQEEKKILDFGASYLLAEFLKKTGYWKLFRETLLKWEDTLLAMVFYYVEMHSSNRDAFRWLEGSYSKILFPRAQLQSQRISELLDNLGKESVLRRFFQKYLNMQLPKNKKFGILIDSTGLPNDIQFPLTALNNHNGLVSKEARLILVVDRKSGMPLFFRYNAGNIVDVTTLKATLEELRQYKVFMNYAIVDAGYCSEDNIRELYKAKIPFLTRLPTNRKIFTDAIAEHGEDVLRDNCRHVYQKRMVGIKRINTSLYDNCGYVYLCVDYNNRNEQLTKFTINAIKDKIPRDKWKKQTADIGFFALISSEKIELEELLPLYYTRQAIEQVFDLNKNNVNLLPLRSHGENTFRGHLMLTFLASLLYILLNKCFKSSKKLTAESALIEMRNLKCKVFDDCLTIKEITKNMREISDISGIIIPEKIPLPLEIN